MDLLDWLVSGVPLGSTLGPLLFSSTILPEHRTVRKLKEFTKNFRMVWVNIFLMTDQTVSFGEEPLRSHTALLSGHKTVC